MTWIQILLALLCLLLPVLWVTSRTFRFWTKVVGFYSDTLLTSVLVCICSIPTAGSPENFSWTKKWFFMCTAKYGIEWDLRNKHHLNSDNGPIIVVCNHQSALDMVGMMRMFPNRCVPLAKKSLSYALTFGLAARICGVAFIDRFKREDALKAMQKVVDRIHNESISIWIYPEGTRNRSGGMLPFKKGAFHLAVQAGIPIVPVVFSEYSFFYSVKKKIFNMDGYVIAEALPPVPVKETDDANELLERCRSQMEVALARVSKEATETYLSRRGEHAKAE